MLLMHMTVSLQKQQRYHFDVAPQHALLQAMCCRTGNCTVLFIEDCLHSIHVAAHLWVLGVPGFGCGYMPGQARHVEG